MANSSEIKVRLDFGKKQKLSYIIFKKIFTDENGANIILNNTDDTTFTIWANTLKALFNEQLIYSQLISVLDCDNVPNLMIQLSAYKNNSNKNITVTKIKNSNIIIIKINDDIKVIEKSENEYLKKNYNIVINIK
jgi:hypothetical protein